MQHEWSIQAAEDPWSYQGTVPGDKSLSHRALLCGALAQGITRIEGYLEAEDVQATWEALRILGVPIHFTSQGCEIEGVGLNSTRIARTCQIDAKNSGTTARLLMGWLAGYPAQITLTGDASLQKRPMERLARLLRPFGYQLETVGEGLPMRVQGTTTLSSTTSILTVQSAQMKSAWILAALQAPGTSVLSGALLSRDHTERLLQHWGAAITVEAERIVIRGQQPFQGGTLKIPGDPSHAAFLVAATVLQPGASCVIEEVLLNPNRLGFFRILQAMGAEVRWEILRTQAGEPVGKIEARGGKALKAIVLSDPQLVATYLDELPVWAVVAAQASGRSVVTGAGELRYKESDRIQGTVHLLNSLGYVAEATEDGFWVQGGRVGPIEKVLALGDHRLAMAALVGAIRSQQPIQVQQAHPAVSWPGVLTVFRRLGFNIQEKSS